MRQVFIDGFGFWSEYMPGWEVAREVLAGRREAPGEKARRPGPQKLAPAERRRAPDTVCLAMQCADEAVNASGQAAADLPCVFASSHGDLPLTDYLCESVVTDASTMSPTKFHNSVHNAPAGYWTIGAGAHETSTALAAYHSTFGAGLLEALVLCAAEERPVLFVAYDVAATGALAEVTSSVGLLAVAMVLSPRFSPATQYSVDWSLGAETSPGPANLPVTPAALALAGNPLKSCLPFCEAFARGSRAAIELSAGPRLSLMIDLQPGKQA